MNSRLKRRLISIARILFLGIGILVVIGLIRTVGAHTLMVALMPTAVWLPLLLLLDTGRIAADALATHFAYGKSADLLPRVVLIRSQLIANAVTFFAPAGRTAAEATKAALFARWVGWPRATAAATLMQSIALVGGGIISIPCAIAAYLVTGPSLLTLSIVGQGVGVFFLGISLRLGSRAGRIQSMFAKRSDAVQKSTREFQEHARSTRLLPIRATTAIVGGRICQVAQYLVLAHAVGGTVTVKAALVAQGVNMVGLFIGVLVPGQVGATDGAFAVSAQFLGMTIAQALAVALVVHVIQVIWIVIGTLTPIVWKIREI